MITAMQMRAARALLGIDQRALAEAAGLSLPTIQRMEASEDVVRCNVDSLMKLIAALDAAGIELIGPGATSTGGGHGLLGMGERAEALGGTCEAGQVPGGGWRVRARIPIDEEDR